MPGAREAFLDARAVEQLEFRAAGDRFGGFARDDAELGLRPRERGFDIEPGLPAVLLSIERADAGIADACGGGLLVAAGGAHRAPRPGISRTCPTPSSAISESKSARAGTFAAPARAQSSNFVHSSCG